MDKPKHWLVLIGFAIFAHHLFGFAQIPDWDKKQIDYEMDSIKIDSYSSKNILYCANRLKNLIKDELKNYLVLVEISDHQIYINGKKETYEHHTDEIAPTLACLIQHMEDIKASLPDCTFLYIPSSIFKDFIRDENSIDVPILVGDRRENDKNVISFLDPISLWRRSSDWSWSDVKDRIENSATICTWSEKHQKIFWRGFLSDLGPCYLNKLPVDMIADMKFSPRILLYFLSKQYSSLVDAGITNWFAEDIVLANQLGFFEADLTDRKSLMDHLNYKYQIVLDGTVTTYPGYAWRLLSDCCVFKLDSTLYQWFYKGLIPWVHYVPVKTDLSDLVEKIMWAIDHDDKAKEIALNGRKFALENLQFTDFYNHGMYVLEKYAYYQNIADHKQ